MCFLLKAEGGVSASPLGPTTRVCFCHLVQAALDLLPLAFSAHFSFRSSGFFCLPVQRFLTAVINPCLARPETPLPCAMQVSEDQETLFPHHHPLRVLRQPGCFPHGILVLPLPADNAHTELVGESLLPSFSFTLESLYCKTKLTASFFSAYAK